MRHGQSPALHAPVVVLGADSPIGLTIVRELGARGVPVIAHGRSPRALARFSRHARDWLITDAPLRDWLPGFASEKQLAAILAVSEHQLLELAPLRGQLGSCRVLSPDAQRLALVLDKSRTLGIAKNMGIAVPDDWQPLAGEDHAARAAGISYPVAVKWPDPNAVSRSLGEHGLALEKVEYAAGPGELMAILSRYEPLGRWPLVQEYCPGYGLGQLLHVHEGKVTLRFQHRRLREFPPTGGVSALCASVPLSAHRDLMARSEALLLALGWEGPAMVEYRHDPATGKSRLMEVNGRFWGSIPLAWHCGAHFAWETYRCAMIGPGNGPASGPKRMRRARYVIPDARGLLLLLRDRELPLRRKFSAVVRFLADFLDPRVRYYVWSLTDPLPFFSDMTAVVKIALGKQERP